MLSAIHTIFVCLFNFTNLKIVPRQGPINGSQYRTTIISGFKLDEFGDVEQKSFVIDGNLYSYNLPSKLTLGEKISIKVLEKNSKSQFENWLNILTILIRPSKEKVNEFGEVEYEVEPFNGDITVLEKRKEIIKKIPGVNSMFVIKSFTDGILK